MQADKLSVDEIRARIHSGEMTDPLVFFESLMHGQDPRKLSQIFEFVTELDQFFDEDIPREDFEELFNLISSKYRYEKVSMSESHSAAKSLAEYTHPKRKQVDVSGSFGGGGSEVTPLTEDEIDIFMEKFDAEF